MNFKSRLQLQACLAISLCLSPSLIISFLLCLSCYPNGISADYAEYPEAVSSFPPCKLHTKSLKLPNFCCCCSRYTICIIEQQTGQRTGCPGQAGNKLNDPKKEQLASKSNCGTSAQRIRHTLHRVYHAWHAGIVLPYLLIFLFHTSSIWQPYVFSLVFSQQQSGNSRLIVLQTSSQSVANLFLSADSCCRKTVDNGNAGAIKDDALLRLPLGSGPKLNSLCRQASISLHVCLCACMCVCTCACAYVCVRACVLFSVLYGTCRL